MESEKAVLDSIDSHLLDYEWLKQDIENKRKKALEYLGEKWIMHPNCKTRYSRGPVVLGKQSVE